MNFQTPSFIRRHGVVLSKADLPYESALVFNAGVIRTGGEYLMLFRNDYGVTPKDYDDFYAGICDHTGFKTNLGLAHSEDGVRWQVEPSPVLSCQDVGDPAIDRVYDPRITDLGNGEFGVCTAMRSKYGTCGGIAVTRDFHHYDFRFISVPTNRNMVLFPEKIHGKAMRLERPFGEGDPMVHGIWISSGSDDLRLWGESKAVLMPPQVPFANFKIGPAAPPVKTAAGWLTAFHAVEVVDQPLDAWERHWVRRYYAGLMLLDLDDPSKIVAMAKTPLIVPETDYERKGFRGEVIFPCGLIVGGDGEVKIYYGAADTVVCLATAPLESLIQFCFEG